MVSDQNLWIREQFRRMRRQVDALRFSVSYARVTQAGSAPLRIRFEGDAVSQSGSPMTVYRPVLGDRVHVLRWGQSALVLGRAGGRKTSGVITIPTPVWEGSAAPWVKNLVVPLPVEVPAGHTIVCTAGQSNGYPWVANAQVSGTSMQVRLLTNNSAATLYSLIWQLVEI